MKNNRLKTGIIMGMITFLFTLSTNAQPSEKQQRGEKPPTFSELLKEMDTGKDGKLSVAEVKGPLKKIFADIDTNEDGFITEEEFENAPKPKKRARKGNR